MDETIENEVQELPETVGSVPAVEQAEEAVKQTTGQSAKDALLEFFDDRIAYVLTYQEEGRKYEAISMFRGQPTVLTFASALEAMTWIELQVREHRGRL